MHDVDVAVIGGGFAGLIAARDVAKAGRRVMLFEARDRLGGRTYTAHLDGIPIELGAQWVSTETQASVRAEVERYDIPLQDLEPEAGSMLYLGGRTLEGGTPQELMGEVFSPAKEQIDAHIRAITDAIAAGERHPALLDGPADAWIASLDVPDDTRALLTTWVAAIGGGVPSEISAMIMLDGMTTFSMEELLAREEATFTAGTASLVRAVVDDSAGEIATGAVVTRVEQDAEGVRVIISDGTTTTAAVVIVALPVNCLNDIVFDPPISDIKRAASAQRHAGRVRKIMATLEDHHPTSYSLGADIPVQALVVWNERDRSLVAAFDSYGAFPGEATPGSLREALAPFGEFDIDSILEHDWINDPYSKGTWLAWPPGWIDDVVPHLAAREGRVCFAGSDLWIEGAGYVDGAIGSGAAAAHEALALLKA